ncbi:MAG: acetyl-CoA carboxylase, carboxyltransferase subunit beta [Patescibacteria group bacterium]
MPLKELFKTRPRYVTIKPTQAAQNAVETSEKKEIPDGLWVKCTACGQIIYHKELAKNLFLCPRCNHHFRVGARERIAQLMDPESFTELYADLRTVDPLSFPEYQQRIKRAQRETNLVEAVVVGRGRLEGIPVGLGALDPVFIMGSMGSVVGEKVTRLIEYCLAERLPLIIVSVSGGARMQEGILSLMQMAKTSAALGRFAHAGLLYLSVLADAATGGVFASFGMLGDVIICEPRAHLGFAGPIVIQQTIRQSLPPGFQSSEFQLEHGQVDLIVDRRELKKTLALLLRFHGFSGGGE